MELAQIRTFQKVATHQSFSKAAEELHLTQPAVTSQIKNLENELGQHLIDRTGRSFCLTPAGEAFLAYAQQIINLTEQAHATIEQFSNQRGRICIGAGTTTTIFRLPSILSSYHSAYPKVEIQIRNGTSHLVNNLVYENAVDLGLVTTIDDTLNLETIPVFEDEICLVAPGSYTGSGSIRQLENEPLVLFRSGSGFRRYLEEQFKIYHFTPKVAIELESIEAIIRFVQYGLGMAFLPEIAVAEELKNGLLKRITLDGWAEMTRHTYLVYRKDKYLTWPLRVFLEQVKGI